MKIRLEKFNPEKHDKQMVATLIYDADIEFNTLVYGKREKAVQCITRLLSMENNYFAHPYVECVMDEEEIAGVVVSFHGQDKKAIDQVSGKAFCQVFGLWSFLKKIPTFIKMGKIVSNNIDEDGYYIHSLCVRDSYRSRGIGTQIINELAKKHTKLYLDVNIHNTQAIKFYQKTGFNIESENIMQHKNRKMGTFQVKKALA
ncbi:GNAT family N-acetyltransferase [Dethiobacter alkaliphilus]|uniref:GCN5-related N-acetyltransferase n=1 Tax=Dethiobacter alkaliphilus AHT 1 TaxID=555088 RepID=C0GCI0_DETAL|nr:N-acetyltransferase [Dethiobacter alkaliphilus]EEG78915.1 GCN5-related N-acetyltransferase [Dethiobacter alkaliphilus AHT 1]